MAFTWLPVLVLVSSAVTAPAQQATAATDRPIPNGGSDRGKINYPELIHRDAPDYPVEAQFQQMDGLCLVSLVVDVHGEPQETRIVHCSDPSFEGTSVAAAEGYRFKAATTQSGNPVPATVSILFHYHSVRYALGLRMLLNLDFVPDRHLVIDRFMTKGETNREMSRPIHYGFLPKLGGPANPDSDGVYPFTRSVTGPRVIKFADEGYGRMAFAHDGSSDCEVVLTISAKGKAANPQLTHCERPELEKLVVESLLKSDFKPGMVKGKAVPMRASIHVNYGEVQSE